MNLTKVCIKGQLESEPRFGEPVKMAAHNIFAFLNKSSHLPRGHLDGIKSF